MGPGPISKGVFSPSPETVIKNEDSSKHPSSQSKRTIISKLSPQQKIETAPSVFTPNSIVTSFTTQNQKKEKDQVTSIFIKSVRRNISPKLTKKSFKKSAKLLHRQYQRCAPGSKRSSIISNKRGKSSKNNSTVSNQKSTSNAKRSRSKSHTKLAKTKSNKKIIAHAKRTIQALTKKSGTKQKATGHRSGSSDMKSMRKYENMYNLGSKDITDLSEYDDRQAFQSVTSIGRNAKSFLSLENTSTVQIKKQPRIDSVQTISVKRAFPVKGNKMFKKPKKKIVKGVAQTINTSKIAKSQAWKALRKGHASVKP